MNEWIQFLPLQDITVNLIILCGGYLVFTRKIIWHKDYEDVLQENKELKELVFRLLGATEKLAIQSEVNVSKTVGNEGDGHNVVP